MASPCETCPFLREGGVRLLPGRVLRVAGDMLRADGPPFFCHKTLQYGDEYVEVTTESQHCAGALLFAVNHSQETSVMRQARRLGWDPATLRGHDRVFGSLEEMLTAASDVPGTLW
jgi:hypothetical protein